MSAGRIVEEGLVGQVFNEPKHEYSDQLRQAIPVPVPRSLRVTQPGTPTDDVV